MILSILRSGRVALVLLACLACSAWADQGPLPTQIRLPLHLLFLTPRPVSAAVPPEGTLVLRASLDFSRISVYEESDQWVLIQDMEMTVAELSFNYALTDRVALRCDLPLVSMNSGFLDHYVNEYHEHLGIHSSTPDNVFVYEASKDGQVWLEGEPGRVALADITLSAQWSWLPSSSRSGWCSSLMASIKLPTGNPRRGYGSGRMDAGLFAPSQWHRQQWSFYIMPGIIWPGDPDTDNISVNARQSLTLFAGTSYIHNDHWQWLLQFNYFSPLLERTGIEMIDDGAIEMTIGLRYSVGRHLGYEFGFSEDIFTIAAPDFTLHLGVVWRWGAGPAGA